MPAPTMMTEREEARGALRSEGSSCAVRHGLLQSLDLGSSYGTWREREDAAISLDLISVLVGSDPTHSFETHSDSDKCEESTLPCVFLSILRSTYRSRRGGGN